MADSSLVVVQVADSSLAVILVADNVVVEAVNLDEDNARFCPKQVLQWNQIECDQPLHVLRRSKHEILRY
jgi:hypothetical protein